MFAFAAKMYENRPRQSVSTSSSSEAWSWNQSASRAASGRPARRRLQRESEQRSRGEVQSGEDQPGGHVRTMRRCFFLPAWRTTAPPLNRARTSVASRELTFSPLTDAPPCSIRRRASLLRGAEPRADHRVDHREARVELGPAHLERRQVREVGAAAERRPCPLLGAPRLVGAVHDGGQLAGQQALGLVDALVAVRAALADLGSRQEREAQQEPLHVVVGYVDPVLVEVVGAGLLRVEEEGAGLGLAHLLPVRPGDERRGQGERLAAVDAADEVHARDDVAPLVVAAHLQPAAVPAVQHEVVVGLQELVVELDERQAGLEPHLVGLEGQHPVDGEVPADVAQELDVVQGRQPFRVVEQEGLALGEIEEPRHLPTEGLRVGRDGLDGQDLPHLGLARRVADPGRAAAHERDGPMAGALQVRHGHQRLQVADVQAVGGRVEADVEGRALPVEELREARLVRALADEAALLQRVEYAHRPLTRLPAGSP